MAKKSPLTPQNLTQARIARTEAYAAKIRAMFDATVQRIIDLNKRLPEIPEGEMFSFDAQTEKLRAEVEGTLRQLHAASTAAIQQGIRLEWDTANAECDNLLESQFGRAVVNMPQFTASNDRSDAAMRAFIARSEAGMNLSERVWQSTRQLRDEMEIAITVAVGDGTSAARMSRNVRKYLNDPDLMFRRFRYKDPKTGEWKRKWKKRVIDPATGRVTFIDYDKDTYRDQWTGRGYYKSAAQNAMRVARTETNIAYRRADHDRWQGMDFVLGQRVHLSRSHPQKDICDKLAGDYPKEFVFDGWHPQCFCFVTPILVDDDTMDEILQRDDWREALQNIADEKSIKDYPEHFKQWVSDNAENIEAARQRGTEPYFIRNNPGVIDDILNPNVASLPIVPNVSASVADVIVGRSPEQIANVRELELVMNIQCGEPMTFDEANEMRANPNYRKGVKYRQNCQSSVVANELRRLGFDVEAYGNTKEDWHMPSILAKRPEIAFMDANGNPPIPIGVKYNVDLMSSLNDCMTAPGRYHLRFRFGDANNTGHIITAERLADGSLRIYDPQNGKIIKDFSEYTAGVRTDSFQYYRVDNLRINPDVARGVVKPIGTKGDAPRMKLPEIQHILENGWYGDFKPEYADLLSTEIQKRLSAARTQKEREQIIAEIKSRDVFAVERDNNTGNSTYIHPGHKTKDKYWPHTKRMAQELNRRGRDVIFLPESDNVVNADAITTFHGKSRIVDFKFSESTSFNTLQQHLAEGFEQSGTVVLKLTKMDAGQFRETIEYMKRNDLPLGDMILINQYGEEIEITKRLFTSGRYINKIRGFLK